MKVILSRKGFDSSFGGAASPIFPDGSMASLPIPGRSLTRYADIALPCEDAAGLVKSLTKGKIAGPTRAHLDPDINPSSLPRADGWLASLGQTGGAQGHLDAQGVGPGDLFLFFGWFREVEKRAAGWAFKAGAPDLHVLFGYLQVGEVLRLGSKPAASELLGARPWLAGHPHLMGERDANNTLYLARPELDVPGLPRGRPGAGAFEKFRPGLALTAPGGKSRSLWRAPPWLAPPGAPAPCAPTYHGDAKRWTVDDEGRHLLQSVAKGQEFVCEPDARAFGAWLASLGGAPREAPRPAVAARSRQESSTTKLRTAR